MALVVHEGFVFENKRYQRGAVLFGDVAVRVQANQLLSRRCTQVDDARFAHLKPAPKPAAPPVKAVESQKPAPVVEPEATAPAAPTDSKPSK